MKPLSQLFTIQQISQKCDVSTSALRFWEKRFGALIAPIRSKGGQGRYPTEYVAMVELIKELIEEELGSEAVDKMIRREIS
jgi:DNA-binding transcriptional MerR regulator